MTQDEAIRVLREALQSLYDAHTKAAGMTPEIVNDAARFEAFTAECDKCVDSAVALAKAALADTATITPSPAQAQVAGHIHNDRAVQAYKRAFHEANANGNSYDVAVQAGLDAAFATAAPAQAQASGGEDGLDIETWPERIWLQHGFEYVPPYEVATKVCAEITWCQDNVNTPDIEYVRADLATRTAGSATPVAQEPLPNEPKPCRQCDDSVGYVCDEHADDDADIYSHACELMEQFQAERKKRGAEVGTEGSLCDGIAWLYHKLTELETATPSTAVAEGVDTELPPLPKVGPICYAMVADIQEYKVPRVGKHLPGVYDAALWSTDQLHAYATTYGAQQREAGYARGFLHGQEKTDVFRQRALKAEAALATQPAEGLTALVGDFRDAIEVARHRAVHAGDTVRKKRWDDVRKRLESILTQQAKGEKA